MFTSLNKFQVVVMAVIFFMIVFAGIASADSLFVDVNSGAYLMDDRGGNPRLLLKFDIPQELSGSNIIFAELSLPLTAVIADSSALTVYGNSLKYVWDPYNIEWNDYAELPDSNTVFPEGTMFATSTEGEQLAYFDITAIVKAWSATSVTNYGIVLFDDSADFPHFTYNHMENTPFAQVKFIFNLDRSE